MPEGAQEISPPLQSETINAPNDIENLYQNEKDKLQELYRNVWTWHGTGRYTQTDNGVVDTLAGILDAQALIPNQDFWNGSKVVDTASATVSRPYATYYSDLHLKGRKSDLLFRDERTHHMRRKTLRRHIHPSYIPNLLRNIPSLLQTRQHAREWLQNHKTFTQGDYPILIGFKDGAFEPMKTEKYLEASEVRTDKTIPITGINHLEVPLKYVEQTEDLLKEKGVNIPVIPRELGERYQTEFGTKDVVSGKGFRNPKN